MLLLVIVMEKVTGEVDGEDYKGEIMINISFQRGHKSLKQYGRIWKQILWAFYWFKLLKPANRSPMLYQLGLEAECHLGVTAKGV